MRPLDEERPPASKRHDKPSRHRRPPNRSTVGVARQPITWRIGTGPLKAGRQRPKSKWLNPRLPRPAVFHREKKLRRIANFHVPETGAGPPPILRPAHELRRAR